MFQAANSVAQPNRGIHALHLELRVENNRLTIDAV